MGQYELRRAAAHFQGTREKKHEIYSGWMVNFEGRADRTAKATAEPGKVYVRIDQGQGSLSGEVVMAWCRFAPVPGWPVIIGFTKIRQTEYTVLDIDVEQLPALAGVPWLEFHHTTHEWGHPTGSSDVVYPRWLQLYDFGVWPDEDATGSLVVNDGVFNPSGTKYGLERQTGIDFTMFQPSGSGERWILVCLTPTGTIELFPGEVVYGRMLEIVDIPAAPVDNWWELAAVRVEWDTTYVEMRPDQENIIDLRFSRIGWPQLKGGGQTGTGGACDCEIALTTELDDNLLELSQISDIWTFDLDQQPSGTIFAAPLTPDGYPSFRFLDESDMPDIHEHYPGTIQLSDIESGGAVVGQGLVWNGGWQAGAMPNWGKVLIVAESGGDYNSIQDALDAATGGETVLLMPGNWTEDITVPDLDIAIVGVDRETCRIEGLISCASNTYEASFYNLTMDHNLLGSTGLFTMTSAGIAYITGCHITAASTQPGASVKAIYISYGAYLYLRNSRITVSATGAGSDGYGINGAASIQNCYVSSTANATAYGLYVTGVSMGIVVRYSDVQVSGATRYSLYQSGAAGYITIIFCNYDPTVTSGSIVYNDSESIAKSLVSTELPSDWDVGPRQIRALSFYSDQTTGVSPLVVSSTTKVTNLNADLLEGYHATTAGASLNQIPVVDGSYRFILHSMIQLQGAGSPTSGKGLELEWDGVQSDILSYDRDGAAYQPLRLRGSKFNFLEDTTNMLEIDGGQVGIAGSPDDILTVNTSTVAEGVHAGSAWMGNWNAGATYAAFAHNSVKAVSGSYAMLQSSGGTTYINAASGADLHFRINNATVFYWDTSNVGLLISGTGDIRVGGGIWVGSTASNPGAGVVVATNDGRFGGGVYAGSTAGNPNTGDVWATVDGRFGGGLYVGSIATNPATGEIRATVFASGWLPFSDYSGNGMSGLSSTTVIAACSLGYTCTLRSMYVTAFVATTNNGSNYWTIALKDAGSATLASVNTSGGSAGTWTSYSTTGLSVALTIASNDKFLYIEVSKTGSPGNLSLGCPSCFVT